MYWHKTPTWLQWLYPRLEWHASRAEPVLYLTFDDGPIPEETPFILRTLDDFKVKGTFFCVGENVSRHPDLFGELQAGGHAVGNHTMHHVKGWGMETAAYLENVALCDETMAASGASHRLFRPPYGKASRKQLRKLKDRRVIMWDVLSGDFDQSLAPKACLENTIRATRNGSYVLFHDNIKAHDRLRYALPRYIEHMLEQGFEFRTL